MLGRGSVLRSVSRHGGLGVWNGVVGRGGEGLGGGSWMTLGFGRSGLRRALSSFAPGVALPMPALSPTMEVGRVAAWHVQAGDSVEPGDGLCDIETDKAVLTFENQDEGIIAQILVEDGGDMVPVGAPLAVMVDDEDAYEEAKSKDYTQAVQQVLDSLSTSSQDDPSPSQDNTSPPPPTSPSSSTSSPPHGAFPSALWHARYLGVDLSGVVGSGKRGMVTKGDVLKMARGEWDGAREEVGVGGGEEVERSGGGGGMWREEDVGGWGRDDKRLDELWMKAEEEREKGRGGRRGFEEVKPSPMRKVIATRLTESKAEVPFLYATCDVVIDDLNKLRERLKVLGVKCSINDLVIQIAARALRKVPKANVQWDEAKGEVVAVEDVDISVAVATEGGLITPIVTNADTKTLPQINAAVKDLATRARKGQLAPEEFQGGSFTVSNLGMFAMDEFSAVINPPQACILAVSQGVPTAIPSKSSPAELAVETRMNVQLSADRRAVDEITAATFLATFKAIAEMPEALFTPQMA